MNKRALVPALTLVAGVANGYGAARLGTAPPPQADAPEDWVARVAGEYISKDRFVDEMRQRGGLGPGQYQQPEQRRALLDALVYQQALVAAARNAGIDRLPEVERTLDQVLANQVLQRQLRDRQQAIEVPEAAVRAFYEANVADYTVPARRRVAMIQVPVEAGGGEAAWDAALAEAEAARAGVAALDADVRHFGALAREHSHDQASRYRGGVVGWLSEVQRDRYAYDPAMLEAAFALEEPGQVSAPVRGADAVYLVRLVDLQPAQARPFEELADGIRQRLLQQRLAEVEQAFRNELLQRFDVVLNDAALAAVAPLSPAATGRAPEPPALPSEG